jgi:hypothetical protein
MVRKLQCKEPFHVPSVLLVIDGDEEPSVEIEVFEVPGVEASNAMGRLA